MRTTALVLATIGAAVWLDLSVLGPSLVVPTSQAAPSPTSTDPIVVDVTLPPAGPAAADAPDAAADDHAEALATIPISTAAATSSAGTGSPPAPAPTAGTPSSTSLPTTASSPATMSTPSPAAPPTTITTTTAPAPPTTQAPTSPATSPPASTTTTTTTTTTTAPPAASYRTVSFDGVGEVVIADHGDGTMEFWSCSPEPGWGYRIEEQSPTSVTVKFRRTSGEGEAKLDIRMRSDGSLSVQRER